VIYLNETSLGEIVGSIEPVSEAWREKARLHLDTLTKPLGSLGRLEDLAAQIVAIRREDFAKPFRKAVYIFAADHGISAEGVSAYPREVTHQMVLNFLAGGAAINVLARLHHVNLSVVDVGVDADFDIASSGLLDHKVAKGSRNMLHEAAMSDDGLLQAISVGVHLANSAADAGENLIAIGEMGIGNTTSASALTCAITGSSANLVTGRGTGVIPTAHAHKIATVGAIVAKHFGNSSATTSPLEILRCVGGLEIAAMAGMMLGAAARQLTIVIDGFISTAAAAIAVALAPGVRGHLVAGHCSEEPGHAVLLSHLQLEPLLTLNMRLGEGTGAVLAMPMIESAMALYNEMATFASAGVSGAPE
jgi:nicotinate-nucleotide--dimethylbenzimidazole phosphoribosyltransferase